MFERFEILEDARGKIMKVKKDYFTKLLNLRNGISFHNCLSNLFATIEPKKFIKEHWNAYTGDLKLF